MTLNDATAHTRVTGLRSVPRAALYLGDAFTLHLKWTSPPTPTQEGANTVFRGKPVGVDGDTITLDPL